MPLELGQKEMGRKVGVFVDLLIVSDKGEGWVRRVRCSSRNGRPKGDAEVPSSRPYKKMKKIKTLVEEVSKKAKFLASAMSTARITKVSLVLCLSI